MEIGEVLKIEVGWLFDEIEKKWNYDYIIEQGFTSFKNKVQGKMKSWDQLKNDKEFWLEAANELEEQLNLVKKHLTQWIEKVSQRVK